MPTNKEIEDAKAHLQDVDNAQESIIEDMFDDLRSNYEDHWSITCQSDIHFADMFLHPLRSSYSLDSCFL